MKMKICFENILNYLCILKQNSLKYIFKKIALIYTNRHNTYSSDENVSTINYKINFSIKSIPYRQLF